MVVLQPNKNIMLFHKALLKNVVILSEDSTTHQYRLFYVFSAKNSDSGIFIPCFLYAGTVSRKIRAVLLYHVLSRFTVQLVCPLEIYMYLTA